MDDDGLEGESIEIPKVFSEFIKSDLKIDALAQKEFTLISTTEPLDYKKWLDNREEFIGNIYTRAYKYLSECSGIEVENSSELKFIIQKVCTIFLKDKWGYNPQFETKYNKETLSDVVTKLEEYIYLKFCMQTFILPNENWFDEFVKIIVNSFKYSYGELLIVNSRGDETLKSIVSNNLENFCTGLASFIHSNTYEDDNYSYEPA